jgi:hypothetical protein
MEQSLRKALAFADAELSAAEVPGLVHELARNPSLVRALQVYVAVGRQRIAKPYAAKRDEPVPQWLVDTVMQSPIGQASHRASGIGAYIGGLIERLKDKYRMPGWSLAAGPAVAAVVAGVFAWLLMPNASHSETLLAMQLQRAIETTASGQTTPVLTFNPVLTFQNKDRTYCRQFELQSGTEQSAALACRERGGNWRVVMQMPARPMGTAAPAGSGRRAVDDYVRSSIAGAPLEADQVARLIDSEWTSQE